MEVPFESFAKSQPFQFLVGPNAKPFYIHSALVEQLSKTLGTLVGGDMIEAHEGSARLDDIDESTFLLFTQFAYTGDFKDPKPDVVLSQSDVLQEETDPVGTWGSSSQRNKKKRQSNNAWASTRKSSFGGWDVEAEPYEKPSFSKGAALWHSFQDKANFDISRPNTNSDPCEEYISVFLCHAKLYIFRDRYGIGPLRDLVTKKLRLALSRFTLHLQRTTDIFELVKYTYANTMDLESGIDVLRDLVSDYLVCCLEKMVGDKGFIKLLQENSDVAKDLMPKIAKRLD